MISLSIIIPIYNGENYIENTLDSIVIQNCNNVEIILINDGSTDDSIAICNYYVEKYSFIKLFNQVNKGLCLARNKGIEEANGEYIIFVDQDDKIPKDSLNMIMNIISANEFDLTIASKKYKEIDLNGNIIKNIDYIYENKSVDNYQEKIKMIFNIGNDMSCFHIWNCVYKRDFLLSNNILFNPFFKKGYEDIDFNNYAVLKSKKMFTNSSLIYEYIRRGSTSTSKKINVNIFDDNLLILKNIFIQFENYKILGYYNDFIFYAIRVWLSALKNSKSYIQKIDYERKFNDFWSFITSIDVKENNLQFKINKSFLFIVYINLIQFFIKRKNKGIVKFLFKLSLFL